MSIGDILPWRREKRAQGGVGSLVFDQERRAHAPADEPSTAKPGGKTKGTKPAAH